MKTNGMQGWNLWKCQKGAQWSDSVYTGALEGLNNNYKNGGPCYFAGCDQDHTQHLVGFTTDGEKASSHFARVA